MVVDGPLGYFSRTWYVTSSCAQAAEWKSAISLLDQLRSGRGDEHGPVVLEADIVSYNAAMNGLAKAGEWKKALALLREVVEDREKLKVRADKDLARHDAQPF